MTHWIKAARLRTLPLSLSGIFLGSLIAVWQGFWNWKIFILACLTTISFQVLSNFANDYGDAKKGTDNNRIGEKRAVSSGIITEKSMRTAIFIMVIISIVLTVWLLLTAFPMQDKTYFWLFLILGILSIIAALFYTIGKRPYGYMAFGDLFVFLFFGILAVCGTDFLYTVSAPFNWTILLPAASIGCFSVAVLNLNNMRDIDNDLKNHKRTIANYLGFKKAMVYQLMLMNLPYLLSLIFILVNGLDKQLTAYSFLGLYIITTRFRRQLLMTNEPQEIDKFLKPLALITLAFALLLGLGINNFLLSN